MSTTAAALRLMNDYKQCREAPPEGCSASPVSDDNLFSWEAMIVGPRDTAWEGGLFQLRITFTDRYPEQPPQIRFVTEIFHPNVFPSGHICLDVIQQMWSPIFTVNSILVSIQSLLTDPNPSSPANPQAAQLYLSDREEYNRRVRRLSQKSLEAA